MLAWRPGELTRRYVAGERARFVSPMALFLFSVFLMFAVFSAIGGPFAFGPEPSPPVARAEAVREHVEERAEDVADLNARRAERARRAAAGRPTAEVDARIRAREERLRVREQAFRQSLARMTQEGERGGARSRADGDDDQPGIRISERPSNFEWLNRAVRHASENPKLLAYKLETNAYKFSWALIPISVPFVALMFLWRRRFHLYDHAIFVTYSLAFMMLFVVALTLAGNVGLSSGLIILAALTVPPVHMFAQLRGAYSLRKRSALWRTIALMIFSFIALNAFAILLLVMGLME